MPSSRLQPPPQTSKKARRAYLKSDKYFEFTTTQKRASERRLELDKRAKALQAKEQRKKENKRKRDDKEAAEREAKKQRIESGKAPIDTLWGKVRASQPRLNAFFAQPRTAEKDADNRSESETESNLDYDYDLEEGVGNNTAEPAAQDSGADVEGLENFFSSTASIRSTDMAQVGATEELAQPKFDDSVRDTYDIKTPTASNPEEPDQALLDAQLSLSQGIFDFDIAEDDDAEWMPQGVEDVIQPGAVQPDKPQSHLLATPSKRKAEANEVGFASPAKSARSALSEMSPSKVNIRAQEKPDILSVASFDSKLPTPSPAKQASSRSAAEVLAMIATQDLEDDEFATDKENEDPWQVESKKQSQKEDNAQKTAPPSIITNQGPSGSSDQVKSIQLQHQSFDESIFDEDDFEAFESGLENDQDDYDHDVDDEALAVLAAQSPSKQRSTAFAANLSSAMSPKRLNFRDVPGPSKPSALARDTASATVEAMRPPPNVHTKSVAVAHTISARHEQPIATQGNNFAFDDVQDDDLTAFADELDPIDSASLLRAEIKGKPSRTIPWNHPSQSPMSQTSDEPLTQDEDPYD